MQDKDDVVEESEVSALFWDRMPEDAATHPDYMAIQSLMYDESTPQEQVENFKDQGNQRLNVGVKSKNKLYFHEAINFYSQGIAVRLKENPSLVAVLYSNKAQAEIYLGNWRKALQDSQSALKLDPENLKACYRGARSALKLDEISQTLDLCQHGLKIDGLNKELIKLQSQAEKRAQVIKSHQDRAEKEESIRHDQALHLMDAFSKRNIRLCQSNFKVGKLKPTIDTNSQLHWPVLFVYPETMQQDIIEDVAEMDYLYEHLDIMFSPDAEPLQWDSQNEYRRDNIEVYFLANAGVPFTHGEMVSVLEGKYYGDPELHKPAMCGKNAAYFSRVEEKSMIHEILSHEDYVIPGVPTFFIVAQGSNYHQKFLESITND